MPLLIKDERDLFPSNDNHIHKGEIKQEGAPNTAITSVNYCTKKKGLFVFFNKAGLLLYLLSTFTDCQGKLTFTVKHCYCITPTA